MIIINSNEIVPILFILMIIIKIIKINKYFLIKSEYR